MAIDPNSMAQIGKTIADFNTAGGEQGKPSSTPDGSDVERFQQALQGGQPVPDAGNAGQVKGVDKPEIQTRQIDGADHKPSFGDSILNGLEKMRGNHNRAMTEVTEAMKSGGADMSAQELLRVQMQLQQVVITQDLTSKVASKATQNLDTLLKSQ